MTENGYVYGMIGGVKLMINGSFSNGFEIILTGIVRGVSGKLNLSFLIICVLINFYIKNKK
jgi:hypothetical protein